MRNLEQLKRALEEDSGKGSVRRNFYPFYLMQAGGQSIIRFLPDKNPNNPFSFFVKNHFHNFEINGKRVKLACKKNLGASEKCPVCDAASDMFNSGNDREGSKYWRKLEYYSNILVLKDGTPPTQNPETGEWETFEKKVSIIVLRNQIFDIIKNAIKNGDIETHPADYNEGVNFIIRKTQTGKYATYITSRFDSKPSPMPENVIEMCENSIVDLSTFIQPYDEDKLLQAFRESLNSEDSAGPSVSQTSQSTQPAQPSVAQSEPVAQAPKSSYSSSDVPWDEDDVTDEFESIFSSFKDLDSFE